MTDKDELARRLETASKKILLVGDIHLMDKPPRNCTEGYLEDILEILAYTAKLEHALDLDAVVWAGDVFHHKQPIRNSHRLVLKAIEAVKKYRRLLIVTGNHDISNDRLETTREQQPLGVLFEAGAEELVGWDEQLPVFGVPWQQRWHEDGAVEDALEAWRTKGDLIFPEYERSQRLVVTHAPIFPPGLFENQMFEVLHPSVFAAAMEHAGSLYYGHIHEDHGIYEADGVTFANVGAISRGSLAEYNRTRKIKAALWTPEHGFLEIDLPHKPAEEVFLLEAAAQVSSKKISDEQFLADVGATRLEISSTAGVIEHIRQLDEETVPAIVKKTAIEMLELQDA